MLHYYKKRVFPLFYFLLCILFIQQFVHSWSNLRNFSFSSINTDVNPEENLFRCFYRKIRVSLGGWKIGGLQKSVEIE